MAFNRSISRFVADRSGNFAMTFGLMIAPVICMAGLAMDYSNISRHQSRLQETSDSAALYAVKELEKAGYAENEMAQEALNVLQSNFDIGGEVTISTDLDAVNNHLIVHMSKYYNPTFLALANPEPVKINVTSEVVYSEAYTGAKCLMTLHGSGKGVLNLNGEADIKADTCSIHVNSSSSDSVDLNGLSNDIVAESNCFVGGVSSGLTRIQPPPEDYCYVLPDPFEEYPTPTVGACDYENFQIHTPFARTITPGVYCGGIDISSGADVTLSPGLYVIKNGWFMTTGSVTLTGHGVTLYFVGTGVALKFSGGTTFDLVAMDSGPLAGFLVFFDINADYQYASDFSGNSNTYFEGVLYFGRRNVSIDGTGDVNSASPFASLIANQVVLNGDGRLNFAVDAAHTDLPIPETLYQKDIEPYLVR